MKLQQDQIWKKGETYFRILKLERLKVTYKQTNVLLESEGAVKESSKKEFCRLLKEAELQTNDSKSDTAYE